MPTPSLIGPRLRFEMVQFSTNSAAPFRKKMPSPVRPKPSIVRFRMVTMMPLPLISKPLADTDVPAQSMVMDLVMRPPPMRAGLSPSSMQLIFPPTSVLASAPEKLEHGLAWVHGLKSVPPEETQVRSSAMAGVFDAARTRRAAQAA